ncbi:MAG: hypothetical protein IJU91_08360, partial [Selenomonadaceae bacterium]|nr:hypothetical protein [Selenomonadaceae bacterium]
MILRTLILYYPLCVSAKAIIKYAYRPSRAPQLCNIRTHISVMNRKFRMLTGRNLIGPIAGNGYTILTPELLAEEKETALSSDFLS